MSMWGADGDELLAQSRALDSGARLLSDTQRMLRASLYGSPWGGRDAEEFRAAWDRVHRTDLRMVAVALGNAAAQLRTHAAAQFAASGVDPNRHGSSPDPFAPCLVPTPLGGLEPSRRVTSFEARSSGREDIVEAFYATTDERRAAFDEIEIRRLDNGRYMVILPGVTDLSEAGDAARQGAIAGSAALIGAPPPMRVAAAAAAVAGAVALEWFGSGQRDTVRRMEYAIGEADRGRDYDNPYARRVKEQMERAGIPAGADVMLVGHSFGAYTAMDLAGDSTFNTVSDPAGYHVQVTHVLAAGADTNWRLPDLPAGTKALVLNNDADRVVQVEDPRHADSGGRHPGQIEVTFAGGSEGHGHHPNNYADHLRGAVGAPALWLEEAGSKYASGGVAYSVEVRDYPS